MSPAERIAQLEAENAKLRSSGAGQVRIKVGDKGGVVVGGLGGRYPVTLYADQWDRLLAVADKIKAFIDANRSQLATT